MSDGGEKQMLGPASAREKRMDRLVGNQAITEPNVMLASNQVSFEHW